MDIPLTSRDLGYGIGIPALVGLALLWNLRWMLPTDLGRRYAPSLALGGGVIAGYFLLPLGPVQPETHWHFLPHALLIAAVVGIVSASNDLILLDRLLLYSIVSLGISFVLIPTWDDLNPPRLQYLSGLSAMIVVLALLYGRLIEHAPGPFLPFIFCVTSICGAVLLAHSGSLLFGQIGLTAVGSLLGMTLACRLDKNSQSLDGLGFPLAIFLCCSMMIGQTNSFSSIPIYAYAVLPVAPLGLFMTANSKQSGIKGLLVRLLLPALICGVALGIAFWFEPITGAEPY